MSAIEDGPIETNVLECLTLVAPITKKSEPKEESLECLLCCESFLFPGKKDDYLAHLYLGHRLVIADVDDIADLRGYLQFWKKEFQGKELEEFCTAMLLDRLPDGTPSKNEKYYLLCDILPKDSELRKSLHSKRLEAALAQHQFERTDRTFVRECLYCRDVIKGLRCEYLEHLFNKHFLQLGKPENLVYVDELIDTVQSKLENLICLYCQKVFKDRAVLKEHMRKKGHKRINPDNKYYDKFFLVNYKNEKPRHVKSIRNKTRIGHSSGKERKGNASEKQTESSPSSHRNDDIFNNSDESDSDWSDWDGEKQTLTCLFCPNDDTDYQKLKAHMNSIHGIDFDREIQNYSFYQKIKIVNYIRRQMHIIRCLTCNEKFETSGELRKHLTEQNHYGIGDQKQWDKPEFFFPTYEDDGILCHLDDPNDLESDESGVVVLCEDSKVAINLDAEALSLENFVFK